ncbi:DUF1317 domain-containing protein, partial [Escherichia sp. S69_ASV_4]|nr:DUF1317 domain-containing protein [Escherichia sp. S69_ASV_4]
MKHPHDNIRVGAITFVYSITKRGWVFPGLSVIRNPLKAQRLAEEINNCLLYTSDAADES